MKKGFTLTEVLITLGIIGVVSALTLPSLSKYSQTSANAMKLKKCVQNIEQIFTVMIAQENTNDIFETQAWKSSDDTATFVNCLQNYAIVGYDESGIADLYGKNSIYSLDNNGKKGSLINNYGPFKDYMPLVMEDGTFIFMRTYNKENSDAKNDSDMLMLGTALNAKAADIYIDVNGKKLPNTVGRDLFHFYLGQDGVLYPDGSKDFAAFKDGEVTDWQGNKSEYKCTDDAKGNNGWPCTARLIEENYKVKY